MEINAITASDAREYQLSEALLNWKSFYKDRMDLEVDFDGLIVPERPEGNWRILVVAKNLTMGGILTKCSEFFRISYNCFYKIVVNIPQNPELDDAITFNSRNPTKNYAVWVKNNREPDVEYLGLSVRDCDVDMKIGMTLLERLLLEFKWYIETRDDVTKRSHLDVSHTTICSGSRSFEQTVPTVRWEQERLTIEMIDRFTRTKRVGRFAWILEKLFEPSFVSRWGIRRVIS